MQETALRPLDLSARGFGVLWIDHALPFQRSANVTSRWPPGSSALPTAIHLSADVQDTPLRSLRLAPLGLGVVSRVQLEPFHRSASVTWMLLASVKYCEGRDPVKYGDGGRAARSPARLNIPDEVRWYVVADLRGYSTLAEATVQVLGPGEAEERHPQQEAALPPA